MPTRPSLDLGLIAGLYAALIAAMLAAGLAHTSPGEIAHAFASPELRASIRLSLLCCTISAILSVWIGVPVGYLLARTRFPGRVILDWLLDIPLVLPPLVVGVCLLLLFQSGPGRVFQRWLPVTYGVPAIIVAQVTITAAYASRSLRSTFEQLSPRTEQVALTLGCSRSQAFWRVAIPEAWPGIRAAGTMAWARSLGEFGPVLIFAGATRFRTEVLPTSVYLEWSVGHTEAALAVSAVMIAVAVAVLGVLRFAGRSAP